MNSARFTPSELAGTVMAPASKSHLHRLLIAAALSEAPCVIRRTGPSEDIDATVRCLCALGASIECRGDEMYVRPVTEPPEAVSLDCGESGTTLRLLAPVAAALCEHVHLHGAGRLNERPLAELLDAMAQNGVSASQSHTPVTLTGRLKSGVFRIPGNISSQYLSGLLVALPLLEGDSRIELTTPLSSSGYVELTRNVLSDFSVTTAKTGAGFDVAGSQRFEAPAVLFAQGDWSGAAAFLAAGALFGPVTATNLSRDSGQRDCAVTSFLDRFGARVSVSENACTVSRGTLRAIEADMDETPDLVPALAAVAACAQGTSRFTGCARLRLKESDRLVSVCETLHAFSIEAEIGEDTLTVKGGTPRGAVCGSFHDHRIAMMAALLAAAADGGTTLLDPECIGKSYPGFYRDYCMIGGLIDGIDVRQ